MNFKLTIKINRSVFLACAVKKHRKLAIILLSAIIFLNIIKKT